MNINHLYNKIPDVTHFIHSQTDIIHIMGITESMLDDRMDDTNIAIQNYTVLRRDKAFELHRGIAVYIHDTIYKNIKRRDDLEIREIESIWLQIEQKKQTHHLSVSLTEIQMNQQNGGIILRKW